MQGGSIEDKYITASSSYDFGSVGPANARIRTEKNGGAWCPRQPITKDSYEWIQVDLVDLKVITQVETQGRFGSGQGQEFVEQYRLEFKRKNSGDWMRYKDKKYNEIFKGNNNTYIAELREINPPLVAKKVRLVPLIPLSRTVCLRFELYGCAWRDGVVSYGMPQGTNSKTTFTFTITPTTVRPVTRPQPSFGGLGQLTDGAEGHSNFRLDPDGSGKKGYEWVGWKNETGQDEDNDADDDDDDDGDDNSNGKDKYLLRLSKVRPSGDLGHRRIQGKSDDPSGGKTGDEPGDGAGGLLGRLRFKGSVRIVFEFDRLRNFSACRVHCNNMFSKEVRLFKRAALHFSLDGRDFKGSDVIEFENTRDSLIEFARNVIIPIPGVLARVVVLELHHDSRWIMISEVRFESGIVTNSNYNLNDDNDDDDEEMTGSEPRSGHLGSEKEVLHPPSNPSFRSSILSFNSAATAAGGDDDVEDDDGDDDNDDDDTNNNNNNNSNNGGTLLKNTSLDQRQSKQQNAISFSTALLDRVVGVISGVIVALLFIIIFVIILYATKKNNNNNNSSGNNIGNVAQHDSGGDKNFQRLLCCRRRRRRCCRCCCCCCLCSCSRRCNMTEADGAKKASLDLSICDSTSWPPTMRKVVSNGNTYSNLSANGCPGDGLPMTTDDVIWRADKFLLSSNNRKLPDLPGKLFLESSLMADTCDLISASSTYAIPELSRVDALKRKNSFCQSRSSPHLYPKTPPFSIFIPPPPPIQPTCRKFQDPKGLTERDYDSANQKGIHSLRHSGHANRCANEDPSNISVSDDDFYDLVTSKLRELDTPLLRQSDVILLQCLGSGEFGQLHLCELRRQTDEEAHKETVTEAHNQHNVNTPPRHPNNNSNNSNNSKNNCSTSSSLSTCDVGDDSRESSAIHAARNVALVCKDHPSPEVSEMKKARDSKKRWTVEKRKRFLVAVKSQNRDDEYSRRHFLSEMERSSRTRNENIAQLLGVSLTDDHGPALVYEFTKHGDLVQFLRGCVLADQLPQMGPEADTLSHGCLTHLGCQVASGMKYLEKCGLVHGDLSARNCLVGPRRLVKICDLARWRSSYRGDYYPPHPWSPPLPIRWMSWEAIHLNQMSSKSDVWSFGVTMWEILSLARLKPYNWLTDEQVLANLINRTHVTEVQQVESDDVTTGSFSPQQHCWQQNRRFFDKQSQHIQLRQMRDFRTTLQQNNGSATTSETLSTKPTTHPTTKTTIKTTTRRNNSQLKTRPQPNHRPVYSTLQQASTLGHEDTLVLLPQPIGCSKEIYDLLLECWTQDSSSRPSFADIHLFLMRYNDGHPNTPKNVASTIGTSRSAAGEAVAVEEHDV